MTTIRFGRREEANDYRDRLGDYVSTSDDRRTKTIRLKPSTPDSIVDRLESTSFASVEEETSSAGMRKLSGDEKKYLKENTSFDWRENGFAAMRAKGALLEQGATDWLDFYEPGEGAGGSLQNLRSSKKSAARGSSARGRETRGQTFDDLGEDESDGWF